MSDSAHGSPRWDWLLPATVLAFQLLVWPFGEGLDTYAFPKEWALLAFGLACLPAVARRWPPTWLGASWWLIALGGVVSAALAVHGNWGLRQASLTVAGAALYTASLREDERQRARLVWACAAFAAVVGLVAVLESQGFFAGLSPRGRAPGSLLGQRNHVAHLCALGLPVLALSALRGPWPGRVAAGLGWTVCALALVWTRSRTGWWGALAGLVALAVTLGVARRWKHLALVAVGAAAAVAVAALTPVRLTWRGERPYLQSLSTMADLAHGSGRGRWVQAQASVALLKDSPVLGVGPGNWVVHYPRVATPGEGFDADAPFPTGRLMTNDVVAALVERGAWPLMAVALAAWLWRRKRLRAVAHDDAWWPTVVTLGVVAVGDSVLQLPAPQAFVAVLLGALTIPRAAVHDAPAADALPASGVSTSSPVVPRRARWLLAPVAVVLAVAWLMATGRLVALTLRAHGPSWSDAEAALRFDPGDTLLRLDLGRSLALAGRCDEAEPHLARARQELPWHELPSCR